MVEADHGIGQEHVPELVRMLRDRSLATAGDDESEGWAPMHALGLLKSLDVSRVITELLPLFDLDFDRVGDELMGIIANAGAAALPPTVGYMRDRTRWVWGRSRAADTLEKIAEQHPELRDQVISILSELVADAENDQEQVGTGAMGSLMELKATETLPLIRRAFELGKIDETAYGAWGDVLTEFGVAPDPGDPLIEESHQRLVERNRRMFPQDMRDNLIALEARQRGKREKAAQQEAAQKRNKDKVRKQKNKRKAASAARKANRKKRK